MKTKSTFTINYDSITNTVKHIFDSLQASKLRIMSNKGKEYIKMPLIIAIIVGIIFPVALIIALVLTMLSLVSIQIERESNDGSIEIKYLDQK